MFEKLRNGSWLDRERLERYPLMLAAMGLIGLCVIWFTGPTAITDRLGRPIGTDFSGVWTAGRMLLEGNATGLFDPVQHFAYQRQFFSNPAIDVYGWHYPPFFLAVAALLATMPYLPALLVWQATTLALMIAVLRSIVPGHARLVTVVALGFPATFVTLGHGHNAFLSAALIGAGLLLLPRRPLLAGVLIGLLAYKPQFGIVLPLVLALGGHWRAFASAAVTVVVMAVLSTLILGPEIWVAFIEGTRFTREIVLEQGTTGWFKIQSAFSAARSFGAPVTLAFALQAALTLAVLATLAVLVLRGADRRLVAAATATAALLATPYCLDYDMAILAVTLAFAVAYALEHGFAPYEKTLYAALWLTPLIARTAMMTTGIPVGLIAMLALFIFVARRAAADAPNALPQFPTWRHARGDRI